MHAHTHTRMAQDVEGLEEGTRIAVRDVTHIILLLQTLVAPAAKEAPAHKRQHPRTQDRAGGAGAAGVPDALRAGVGDAPRHDVASSLAAAAAATAAQGDVPSGVPSVESLVPVQGMREKEPAVEWAGEEGADEEGKRGRRRRLRRFGGSGPALTNL